MDQVIDPRSRVRAQTPRGRRPAARRPPAQAGRRRPRRPGDVAEAQRHRVPDQRLRRACGADLVGAPYADADGRRYQPMLAQPVAVLVADAAGLRRAFDRALARDLEVAVYTDDLFTTGNDEDNRAAVAAVATADLALAGFAACGERRAVDKALDRLAAAPVGVHAGGQPRARRPAAGADCGRRTAAGRGGTWRSARSRRNVGSTGFPGFAVDGPAVQPVSGAQARRHVRRGRAPAAARTRASTSSPTPGRRSTRSPAAPSCRASTAASAASSCGSRATTGVTTTTPTSRRAASTTSRSASG